MDNEAQFRRDTLERAASIGGKAMLDAPAGGRVFNRIKPEPGHGDPTLMDVDKAIGALREDALVVRSLSADIANLLLGSRPEAVGADEIQKTPPGALGAMAIGVDGVHRTLNDIRDNLNRIAAALGMDRR